MINRFYIGLSITKEYDIRTTCGTKEELPFLTPEEFDRRSSMQPVMQLRVPMNHPGKYDAQVLISTLSFVFAFKDRVIACKSVISSTN